MKTRISPVIMALLVSVALMFGGMGIAHAYQLQVVTDNGFAFIARQPLFDLSGNDGKTGINLNLDPTNQTVNGIGLGARMIGTDYDRGFMTHGVKTVGDQLGVRPTTSVTDDTKFTALVSELNKQNAISHNIPAFGATYTWSETNFMQHPSSLNFNNTLGYSNIYEYNVVAPGHVETFTGYGIESVIPISTIRSIDGGLVGISFTPSGDKMFLVGNARTVFEYDLAIPWDITTAVINNNELVLESNFWEGNMKFSPDGLNMYMGKYKIVEQYGLITPWDISSAAFTNSSNLSEFILPDTIAFSHDGTKMFMTGRHAYPDGTIYEYDLTTAWDISTLVHNDVEHMIGNSPIASLEFADDGMLLFALSDSSVITKYTLGTAYDIGTAVADITADVSVQDDSARAIAFSQSGLFMYMVADSSETVYAYSLGTSTTQLDQSTATTNAPVEIPLVQNFGEYEFDDGALTLQNNILDNLFTPSATNWDSWNTASNSDIEFTGNGTIIIAKLDLPADQSLELLSNIPGSAHAEIVTTPNILETKPYVGGTFVFADKTIVSTEGEKLTWEDEYSRSTYTYPTPSNCAPSVVYSPSHIVVECESSYKRTYYGANVDFQDHYSSVAYINAFIKSIGSTNLWSGWQSDARVIHSTLDSYTVINQIQIQGSSCSREIGDSGHIVTRINQYGNGQTVTHTQSEPTYTDICSSPATFTPYVSIREAKPYDIVLDLPIGSGVSRDSVTIPSFDSTHYDPYLVLYGLQVGEVAKFSMVETPAQTDVVLKITNMVAGQQYEILDGTTTIVSGIVPSNGIVEIQASDLLPVWTNSLKLKTIAAVENTGIEDPYKIAESGNILYMTEESGQTVHAYDTSGTRIPSSDLLLDNSFESGDLLEADSTSVYILDTGKNLKQYSNTDGSLLNTITLDYSGNAIALEIDSNAVYVLTTSKVVVFQHGATTGQGFSHPYATTLGFSILDNHVFIWDESYIFAHDMMNNYKRILVEEIDTGGIINKEVRDMAMTSGLFYILDSGRILSYEVIPSQFTANVVKNIDDITFTGAGRYVFPPEYVSFVLSLNMNVTLSGDAEFNIIQTPHQFGITEDYAEEPDVSLNADGYHTFVYNELYENDLYMEIYLPDSASQAVIKGWDPVAGGPLFKVDGLQNNDGDDFPWQITMNNTTVSTGVSENGEIELIRQDFKIDKFPPNPADIYVFHAYPDATTYRGNFSTVILDGINDQTVHIDTIIDRVYVVHAYVSIPVIGAVDVTNLSLNNRNTTADSLPLDYLNLPYNNTNMMVPVIPGYTGFNASFGTLNTTINYADVLNPTFIQVAVPNSYSEIQVSEDSTITDVDITTGTVTYHLATDAVLQAQVLMSIDGSLEIVNEYCTTSPPPPPRTWDPLEGWLIVWVNGEEYEFEKGNSASKIISLGKNEYPNETLLSNNIAITEDGYHDSTILCGSGTSAHVRGVNFEYPVYPLIGAVEIRGLEAGDMVEFFAHARIFGGIEPWDPRTDSDPNNNRLIIEKSQGRSDSTIEIISASVSIEQ